MCTQDMGFVQDFCQSFGPLHEGTLMARGSLESLRLASGAKLRASLRLKDGDKAPEGFRRQRDGLWQKALESEEEMPRLIMQVVSGGGSLYEARVVRPTLWEIYQAHLDSGRRREAEIHGETGDEAQLLQAEEPATESAVPEGG